MPIDTLGLPGLHAHIATQPTDDPSHKPASILAEQEGDYHVTFTMARPGFSPQPEKSFTSCDRLEGDSHLAIRPPATGNHPVDPELYALQFATKLQGVTNVFVGTPNREGFLAKIALATIRATSFADAEAKALAAIDPTLSAVSLRLDIPLDIYQVDIVRRADGTRSTRVLAPYPDVPWRPQRLIALANDFRLYASLYREALGSNRPAYQYLCFYKIVEGAWHRANREAKERRLADGVTQRERQSIPATLLEQRAWVSRLFPHQTVWDDDDLREIFPSESHGRPVGTLLQEALRTVRHRIAHIILDDGEPSISFDCAEDRALVFKWLPLIKCLSRYFMLRAFPDAFGEMNGEVPPAVDRPAGETRAGGELGPRKQRTVSNHERWCERNGR